MVDEWLSRTLSLLFHYLRRCTLGADEQYFVFVLGHATNNRNCFIQRRHCKFEVDDMNFVACTKDKWCHFWVPVTSLVTKVSACFQQIAHADICHVVFLIRGSIKCDTFPAMTLYKAPHDRLVTAPRVFAARSITTFYWNATSGILRA